MLFWRKKKNRVEGAGSSDPAPVTKKAVIVNGLVQVSTDNFEAVVQPITDLPHSAAMAIMLSPTPEIRFALTAQLFRDLLAPEKLHEFDRLNFKECVKVLENWLEYSVEEM